MNLVKSFFVRSISSTAIANFTLKLVSTLNSRLSRKMRFSASAYFESSILVFRSPSAESVYSRKRTYYSLSFSISANLSLKLKTTLSTSCLILRLMSWAFSFSFLDSSAIVSTWLFMAQIFLSDSFVAFKQSSTF